MYTDKEKIQEVDGKAAVATESYCLSTDSKPLDVGNGAVCIEMDTSKMFFFDLENKTWREFV